ncbi:MULTISPECIES: SH3 domain-containing protein [Stenotrophomonas maltophilia group]|uniref:SH3 domain-containing protein n=1 Tax=Stenotrophomonas TaxID=40323 RepID=UPI0021C7E72B|nr:MULTISPECIES: SH3 domain-containing protein [Stenotrophomonas maltophilia group]MCU1056596.1 SH3 domain-containing protein [Stenotrophomonas maltophilia]
MTMGIGFPPRLKWLLERGSLRSVVALTSLILLQIGLFQPGTAWSKPIGEQAQLSFEVAPATPVTVSHQRDGSIQVQLPSGATQQLPRAPSESPESETKLMALDVDFDGQLDLVVQIPVGMVNFSTLVYKFDRNLGRFMTLPVIQNARRSCGEFGWIELDSENQVLRSSCRSAIWRVDVYRPSNGVLYLYRSERMLALPKLDGEVLSLEATRFDGPLAVWTGYSATAEIEEQVINDGLAVPDNGSPLVAFTATVVPARLFLFDQPGASSTRRYLVRGDRVELLDEQGGWVKLRYRNPKQGAVVGWINVND